MATDLDTRAHEAAASLRRAAADRDVPEWSRDSRPGAAGGRAFVWLAAAVVIVLALIVAGRAWRDDEQSVATTPGVPALIPDAIPDGMEPTGGADLPLPLLSGSTTLVVYGTDQGDDPFAGGDLAVLVVRSNSVEPDGGGDQSITVRDRPGRLIDGEDRIGVAWLESDDVMVTVTSDRLTEAEVLSVAEGLKFDDEYGTVDASVLPSDLVELATFGSDASLNMFPVPVLLPQTVEGHIVGYQGTRRAGDGRRRLLWWSRRTARQSVAARRRIRPAGHGPGP